MIEGRAAAFSLNGRWRKSDARLFEAVSFGITVTTTSSCMRVLLVVLQQFVPVVEQELVPVVETDPGR